MKTHLFILLSMTLTSCMYTGMDDDYQQIDKNIKPYVDQFVSEAASRGVTVDISNLKISFVELKGKCAGDTNHRFSQIRIDSTTANWKYAPKNTLWHELGHLYLHRGHDDSVDSEGEPKSIMNSGVNTPKFERVNSYKEKVYLNELFSNYRF